jgi:hypothetical protein
MEVRECTFYSNENRKIQNTVKMGQAVSFLCIKASTSQIHSHGEMGSKQPSQTDSINTDFAEASNVIQIYKL